jgi:hypothetical protein
MKEASKKLLRLSAIFLAGAVFGPPAIAVLAASPAAFDEPLPWEKYERSRKLFEVYRANSGDRLRFFLPDDRPIGSFGAECGYQPDQVFEGKENQLYAAREANQWVDLEGYILTRVWTGHHQNDNYHAEIAKELESAFSQFESEYLRRCIEGTLLAPICSYQVSKVASRVDQSSKNTWHNVLGAGYEDRVVCGYVDGIAARRNLMLSNRSN